MSAEDRTAHHLQAFPEALVTHPGFAWGTCLALIGLTLLLRSGAEAPLPGVREAAEFVGRPPSISKGIETGFAGQIAFRLTPDLALTCRIDVFGDPFPEVVRVERGEISDVPVARPADLAGSVASFCQRALEAR